MKDEINIVKQDGVTLMDIRGDVTVASEPIFDKAYRDVCDDGANRILLKFAVDAYINSGGIALLIQLFAQAKKHNQQIGITGLSDHFKKIFRMVGITKFARIYDSVDDAVKDMTCR